LSEEEMNGLGDFVEKVITKIGDVTKIEYIRKKKGCEGCRKRKEWLNEKVPFTPSSTPIESTEGGCTDCEKKKKKKDGGCKSCGKNK
jgi:hypothetical protein